MKKIKILSIVFLLVFLMTTMLFAQWNGTNPLWTNSLVGIGTDSPNSAYKLDVNGSINARLEFLLKYNGAPGLFLIDDTNPLLLKKWQFRGPTSNQSLNFNYFENNTYATRFTIMSNGNIGIGIDNPAEKLHVQGHIQLNGYLKSWGDFQFRPDTDGSGDDGFFYFNNLGERVLKINSNETFQFGYNTTSAPTNIRFSVLGKDGDYTPIFSEHSNPTAWTRSYVGRGMNMVQGDRLILDLGYADSYRNCGLLSFSYDASGSVNNRFTLGMNGFPELFAITGNGLIGINTLNPTHLLTVNGSIKTKEIIVETGWSDFVFKNDYNLKSLKEVEKHIKEKGHLPDMPSENEVKENGVNLGQMDAKLLQKIEELTLYMIQLKKENEELKNKVNNLEKLVE